ncbi:MarR family winged helix-turn-helix transcriptional regulator [Streptomyces chumphonensis]|uniref:MarR family winged helix-turn-helix transcriptional regulator n=1 Tax=Streptomyces chumphonensis TaxID=1214925 RepID=UPI003D763DC7
MSTPDERPPAGAPTPGPDLLALAVRLRGITASVTRTGQDFARSHGLHHTDLLALIAILDGDGHGGPMTPGRLRAHLNLTSGAVTACLDRLERGGHITRTRDTADGRVVHLHYAPAGRTVAREAFRPLARRTDAVRRRFTAEEIEVVLRFLTALDAELDAEARPGTDRPPPSGT